MKVTWPPHTKMNNQLFYKNLQHVVGFCLNLTSKCCYLKGMRCNSAKVGSVRVESYCQATILIPTLLHVYKYRYLLFHQIRFRELTSHDVVHIPGLQMADTTKLQA